jgi:hypothetical protein
VYCVVYVEMVEMGTMQLGKDDVQDVMVVTPVVEMTDVTVEVL